MRKPVIEKGTTYVDLDAHQASTKGAIILASGEVVAWLPRKPWRHRSGSNSLSDQGLGLGSGSAYR